MTQQIYIECGKGTKAYQVTLTAESLDVFVAASQKEEVKGKTGEALVSAILAAAGKAIFKIERKNMANEYNDGPKGEPAYVGYEQGRLKIIQHAKKNLLSDSIKGEPAVKEFDIYYRGADRPDADVVDQIKRYIDGKLNDGPNGEPAIETFYIGSHNIERYKNDKRNDGANEAPALERYDYKGQVTDIEHWTDGAHNDSPSGKPAVQKFSHYGALEYIESWKDGTLVKRTTGAEMIALLKKPEEAKKIHDITSAVPAIKIRIS